MNREKLILLIIIALLPGFGSKAQNGFNYMSTEYEQSSRFGITAAYNLNQHFANFQKLPGIPNCCPSFEYGSGSGYMLGILYESPVISGFRFGASAAFSNLSALLKKEESFSIIVNNQMLERLVSQNFEHTIDVSISDISLEPKASYRIFEGLNASAGFHIGYVITKDYTQSEKIIGNGTFLDDNGNDTYKRTRNDTSGTLPDASGFYAAVIAGISYDLPLNSKGNLILAPEVNYALGLTPVIPDLSWSINSLRLGLAFKYCFGGMAPEKVIPPTAPPISEMPAAPIPPEEKPNILSADIIAVGLANDSTESALDKLKVEEFTSTLMTPLLNYIFFDDNSAEIPSRYKQINQTESRDFVVDKINSSEKLPTYYHILNIIGRRLRENPGSKITLIGCNSDVGEEAGNTELSKSRAETVKQYFTNIWSIEPARISVQPRNLPHKPAIKTTEEGAAENRRVEIQSDNPDMLAPVVTGEQYYQTEPLSIRFKNKIVADAGVKSWKIEISQSNKILNKFEGEGNLPPSFDWKINEAQASIPRYGNELNYKLTVTDMDGKEKSASKTFKVEQITISQKKTEKLEDKEIDFFSLILFDINSAELSQTNKKIADFVKSRIKSNSTVKISGFTDKTGLPENNSKLSLDRARNTAVYLGMESKPDTKVEINGFGDSRLICDNALPEGRYYCRIVDIVIETPIKSE